MKGAWRHSRRLRARPDTASCDSGWSPHSIAVSSKLSEPCAVCRSRKSPSMLVTLCAGCSRLTCTRAADLAQIPLRGSGGPRRAD